MAKKKKVSAARKAVAKKSVAKKSGAGALAEGKAAPALTLPGSNGQTTKLSSFKGKKPVVLFFYPRDMTSGCTTEACGFRDRYAAFRRAAVEVFGVSPDSLESHERFISKKKLPYVLLSDESKKTLTRFGVWREKTMYGRTFMGVARTTVVIDKNGKVAKIFEKVNPKDHAEEVLDFIKHNL